jgi:phosphohistidine phosphatase SixA
MLRLGIGPIAIWSSPHIRALQTATILEGVLDPPDGLTIRESLSFEGGSAAVRAEFDAAPARLLVVGHEPILSDLISELCASGRLRIQLKKCSLVHIAMRPGPRGLTGELISYLSPRALRASARREAEASASE